jgi:hypothetical protein
MRVEDMRNKVKETTFEDIKIGECFIDDDNDLSMKVESNSNYNAVLLPTGLLWICDEGCPVTPVKTHIVIESEE